MRGRPAGSIVQLSPFRWHGEGEPALGMYLLGSTGAYLIVGLEETARSGPEHDPRVYGLVCEKVELEKIPDGAITAGLYWDPRERKVA